MWLKITIESMFYENEFKNKNIHESYLPECTGSADKNNFRKPSENISLFCGARHI